MRSISTAILAVALAATPLAAAAQHEMAGPHQGKQYQEETERGRSAEMRTQAASPSQRQMSQSRQASSRQMASAKKAAPSRRAFTARYEGQARTAQVRQVRRGARMACPGGMCPAQRTAAMRPQGAMRAAPRMQMAMAQRGVSRFGAQQQQFGFGMPQQQQFGFGMPQQQQFGFGMQAQQPFGFDDQQQFGYGMQAQQPFGFGAQQQQFGFGAQQQQFGFGMPQQQQFGYGFGMPQRFFTGQYGGYGPGRIVYGQPWDWCNMSYNCCW